MRCHKCNSGVESGMNFIPIEPPRKNRKWACEKCMSESQRNSVPEDIQELTEMVSGRRF